MYVPRANEVKNQRVIAKRTSQIMKYGQDVIYNILSDILIEFEVNLGLMMDGFNGMSTQLGHVMPKRTMSKTIEKIRQ